jgi:triphosphatase
METELKFTFPAEMRAEIDRVLGAKGMRAASRARRNDSVYFDTPDLALAAAGFSLRVRHVGRSYVQTLKSLEQTGGAAARRFEREWKLDGHGPNLGLLDGTPAAPVIASGKLARLRPIFATGIQRTIHPIEFGPAGAAKIELAIDEGEIRAGEAALPVHELELELKDGPLESLYRFALELQAELPLTIAAESKAGRGFRLRSGREPEAHKAEHVSLTEDVSTEDGLRLIVESGIGQFIANLPAISLGGDGEGVHQARVAIRRLRSALVLFGEHIEPSAAGQFERELQHLGRVFGEARDWDVFVLETLPRACDEGMEGDWLNLLAPPADDFRRDAHRAVARLVASSELTGFVVALAAWTAGELWVQSGKRGFRVAASPLRDLAPEMLDRLEAKVFSRARRIARQSAEERHALRKAFKKLRYAVEFFAGLYDRKAVKRYRHVCEGVQEILGTINDTVATDALAAQIGEGAENSRLAPSIGVLARWSAHNREVALKQLPGVWDEFRREKPFWR